jgi:hypothetical protein
MVSFAPTRFAAIAGLALSATLPAQSPQTTRPASTPVSSTLPASAPTAPEQPPIPLTPSQRPPTRAQVTYADGKLSIIADNASLNQILRQIAADTGMKITGGVTDERVFGQYGPASPDQILAELLDGTSSNMVLVHRNSATPTELVLTPRQGGATPPNPNAAAFDDRQDQQPAPQAEQPTSNPGGQPVFPATSLGTPAGASQPNAQPNSQPNASQPNAAQPNAAQPDSPNGVKTPQQIYEQLQRMRQQQQQQQPTQPQ